MCLPGGFRTSERRGRYAGIVCRAQVARAGMLRRKRGREAQGPWAERSGRNMPGFCREACRMVRGVRRYVSARPRKRRDASSAKDRRVHAVLLNGLTNVTDRTCQSFVKKCSESSCLLESVRLYSLRCRDVAQFGRVQRSGRWGRWFKSCHPDQTKHS